MTELMVTRRQGLESDGNYRLLQANASGPMGGGRSQLGAVLPPVVGSCALFTNARCAPPPLCRVSYTSPNLVLAAGFTIIWACLHQSLPHFVLSSPPTSGTGMTWGRDIHENFGKFRKCLEAYILSAKSNGMLLIIITNHICQFTIYPSEP